MLRQEWITATEKIYLDFKGEKRDRIRLQPRMNLTFGLGLVRMINKQTVMLYI